MSNRYWGWGKEDDDFYLRLNKANISLNRPDRNQFKGGKEFTFLNIHDNRKRKRDNKVYQKQKEQFLIPEESGLNNVKYVIESRQNILIDNFSCLIINVKLICNKLDTHWCSFGYQFED